jgi:hypothetical protein
LTARKHFKWGKAKFRQGYKKKFGMNTFKLAVTDFPAIAKPTLGIAVVRQESC